TRHAPSCSSRAATGWSSKAGEDTRKRMSTQRTFEGKAVLVAGGSRGIGSAIARRFAGQGAAVAISYRSSGEAAERLVEEIGSRGGNAVAIGGDIADATGATALVQAAHNAFGRLDVVVNSAGVGDYLPLESIDEAHYRKVF